MTDRILSKLMTISNKVKQEIVDIETSDEDEDSNSDKEKDCSESTDEDSKLPGVIVPAIEMGLTKRKNQLTLKEKLEALKYLETNSVCATSRYFGVAPKSIREWRSKKEIIERLVREELLAQEQGNVDEDTSPRKRIPGAGRKKQEKKLPPTIKENPNKRQRRSLKISDKVEIIRLIENGLTQSDVARQLRFSQSTVQTIFASKQQIMLRHSNPRKKWKNLHWKRYSQIDEALFNWYKQCKDTGILVETKILVDKAREFADYFKRPEFKPQGERWIEMFKKRHFIPEVDRIIDRVSTSVEEYNLHQNYTHPSEQLSLPQHQPLISHLNSHLQNNMNLPNSTSSTNPHDLVPDFDLNSLYSQDPTNTNPSTPLSAISQSQSSPNFNLHIPTVVSMPVTTCDAMKYVELVRSWVNSTLGEESTNVSNAETLNNHLNAIENSILKRRMTEMLLAPVNNSHR